MATLAEIGLDAYKHRRQDRGTSRLVEHDEVLRWGWDGSALLRRLIALDRRILGNVLSDAREGTVAQWAPVLMEHPETWVLLVAGSKRIVGYWHFAALRDEHFVRAKAGELMDSEIAIDMVAPLEVPGFYNLYFVLLGVSTEFPRGGAKLIDAFFDQLESLAARGIFFREVCANAFTKDGKRICEGLGMAPIGPHNDFGTVYALALHPWPQRLKHNRWLNLAAQYGQAFGGEPIDV